MICHLINPYMESTHDVRNKEIERKSKITDFFLVILVGIAIDNFVITNEPLFNDFSFSSFSWDYFISYWLIPLIFLITIIRFFIGNLLHMINLENHVAKEEISSKMWLLDFSILILEAIIFIIMGKNTCVFCKPDETPQKFLIIMIILFFVDVIWILSSFMFGYLSERRGNQITFFDGWIKKCVCNAIYFKNCKRDSIPGEWAILNFVSLLIMLGVLITVELNNLEYFNYLLILFIFLGGGMLIFLHIDKFTSITSTISKMNDSIWKRWLSGILMRLEDKYKEEDNNIKTLTRVMPCIASINLLYFIIIIYYELSTPYNFKLIYLTFIALFLIEAAFIDVMCLDIYKILTGFSKNSKQKKLEI